MWAQVINIIIGLAVMAAPGWLNFPTSIANNNYITGPLIIAFAMIAISDVGRNVRWFNVLAGSWLVVSPFVTGNANPALPVNMLCGILIVLLSLVKRKVKHRFGGGWRSLLQRHPPHMQDANRQL